MSRLTIIGDGAWGTALGLHLHRAGHAVRIWGPFEEGIDDIQANRENRRFLPGIPVPPEIEWTSDPVSASADAEMAVCAVPSQYYAGVVERFSAVLPRDCRMISVTKGLEPETGNRLSQVAAHHLAPRSIAVLSGPSFALEVARGLPAAVVVAAGDPGVAAAAQALFSNDTFRVYTSDDVVGVELGGVCKNVIAIAAGAGDALGFGTNARAALITRGLAEMTRLAVALGAHPATLAGLSGLGDLVLTCTGPLSRNRKLGERIGNGERVPDILADLKQVAEGAVNCAVIRDLACDLAVETPIVDTVYRVLHEGMEPRRAVTELMARDPKPERETIQNRTISSSEETQP